jgi:hypothetical protein
VIEQTGGGTLSEECHFYVRQALLLDLMTGQIERGACVRACVRVCVLEATCPYPSTFTSTEPSDRILDYNIHLAPHDASRAVGGCYATVDFKCWIQFKLPSSSLCCASFLTLNLRFVVVVLVLNYCSKT